jgi:hypothetical protein
MFRIFKIEGYGENSLVWENRGDVGGMILPQRKEIFDAVPKAVFRLLD